jgi:hypothetical protein
MASMGKRPVVWLAAGNLVFVLAVGVSTGTRAAQTPASPATGTRPEGNTSRSDNLPVLPDEMGPFSVDPAKTMAPLPKALASYTVRRVVYKNAFGEQVEAFLSPVNGNKSQPPLDPVAVFRQYGYESRASRTLSVTGLSSAASGHLLRNDATGQNVLLLTWTQQRGKAPEGTNASGPDRYLVWTHTQVHPSDTNGGQARRNLEIIGQGVFATLKRQGYATTVPYGGTTAAGTGSPDSRRYLKPLPAMVEIRQPLLPLKPGNRWDMKAVCAGEVANDTYIVTRPLTVDGVSGLEVEQRRSGKRWRREIYRATKDTLYLVAMQDETSELMRYHDPIPVVRYPAHVGDGLTWKGEFLMGKEKMPARAFSRISGQDTLKTAAGKFIAYRVDTIIVVQRGGSEAKFPTVRWLAPGIGMVRRGYADKGRPAFAELTQFTLK